MKIWYVIPNSALLHTICNMYKKKKIILKNFFTEKLDFKIKMCRYYIELAMSVLLLSMIFVFSQQTLLHIKNYTSFEEENEIFKLAFWDFFFLFAVKKKKYYIH